MRVACFMRRSDRIKRKFEAKKVKSHERTEISHPEKKKGEPKSFYYKNYKQLLIIPMLMLVIALVLIGAKYAQTGEFINKGITLKGGIAITSLGSNTDTAAVAQTLRASFPDNEVNVRTIEDSGRPVGVLIETDISPDNEDVAKSFTDKVKETTNADDTQLNIETTDVSLGDAFFKQTMVAVLIAFFFMGIVVFIYFKTLVPSAAVILAAFSNIVVTIAVLNVADIKIGTAGIAGLLMLIGYSVDTDIVLSMRVLKRKTGTVYERIIGAMKTGLTMNLTTLAAVLVALFLSESPVLSEIMLIILIGLIADMINTWIQNAGIIRWYMEKKGEL